MSTNPGSASADHPLTPHLMALGQKVWSFINSRIPIRLQSRISAEDVLQETFLEAFRCLNPDSLTGDNALERWLINVAHNRVRTRISECRCQKRGGDLEFLDPGSSLNLFNQVAAPCRTPRTEAEKKEIAERVREAISQLDPDYQEILILRFYEDKQFPQIAEILGISYADARALFMRAQRQLERWFENVSDVWSGVRSKTNHDSQ